MTSYREFFAELKRRHVFKVAAIYGATSFVILQVADILLPALGLPEWSITFMVAILLLAFPVALIVAWAFEMTPDGVKRTDAAEPGELEQIVAAPASQRWPAGLLALAGVVALVAGAWWAGARSGGDQSNRDSQSSDEQVQLALGADALEDERPSIAVLPFADMSPESDQAYFSDGITEEILNTLAKIRELKIAARTSAFAFRGKNLDMRAIGDSLGVGYLIEGSVRKSGDELRITAQLIDAEDGTHVWTESYDRTMDDVFAIQSEIAEAIAEELRIPLGLADADRLVVPTADLEAYDLYLAGRARVRERGAGLAEARRLFAAAIARDSSWAPAWAALAEASELSTWYPESWDTKPADLQEEIEIIEAHLDVAVRAARRAIALDSGMASAHVALGSVARNRRQWQRAERAYLQAMALDPDDAEAHHQYSEMLSNMGRIREAVMSGKRALDLDPAPIRYMNQAMALWTDDRLEEGRELVEEGIALDPGRDVRQLRWAWQMMNVVSGDYDDVFRYDGSFIEVSAAQQDSARRALVAGTAKLMPVSVAASTPLLEAIVDVQSGRTEAAAASIRRFMAGWPYGNLGPLWLPIFDTLHAEPDIQAILVRNNLAGRTVDRTPRGEAEADGSGRNAAP